MRLHLLLSELTLMDVLLSFQAAVASSAGTPCLLAASSVRWSFRIYRLRSTSTMTTSPETGCHGYCPPATTPFQLLRDVGHFMDTGSLHIVFPVSGACGRGGGRWIWSLTIIYSTRFSTNWTHPGLNLGLDPGLDPTLELEILVFVCFFLVEGN